MRGEDEREKIKRMTDVEGTNTMKRHVAKAHGPGSQHDDRRFATTRWHRLNVEPVVSLWIVTFDRIQRGGSRELSVRRAPAHDVQQPVDSGGRSAGATRRQGWYHRPRVLQRFVNETEY